MQFLSNGNGKVNITCIPSNQIDFKESNKHLFQQSPQRDLIFNPNDIITKKLEMKPKPMTFIDIPEAKDLRRRSPNGTEEILKQRERSSAALTKLIDD